MKENAGERRSAGTWHVEGLDSRPRDGQEGRGRRWLEQFPGGGWFVGMFLVALLGNWLLSAALTAPAARWSVPYTDFLRQVEAGNVVEITATGQTIQGRFARPVAVAGVPREVVRFETERPLFAGDDLLAALREHGVVVRAEPADRPPPLWQQLLFGFGPTLLLFYLLYRLYQRQVPGGLGRLFPHRVDRYDAREQRTTFDDVAGIDDAEAELVEIVDFLRDPDRYTRLGGALPKGVLLSGPPGTGKTLLARAVAGEADVPFFSMSASEFIEMVVGVGARRVRELFDEAKRHAPAIVFIDEIDAIGRARGGPLALGGHDEREQTLNQTLTEMDGFEANDGVVVIAATNRPDVLDRALLRPGRFDRRVEVAPPDVTGRRAILDVHTRGVPLGPDVDLDGLAAATPGMVGADLRNLVNEAALLAARHGHDQVTAADLDDALDKVVLGTERRLTMTSEERERTAYHEAGHALLGMLTPGTDPVRKVSIIPRGRALGVTLQAPDADRYAYPAGYLRGRIVGALGGRAAEELVYGEVTTGAENDLIQVTELARRMVGRWGMSEEIGPLSLLDDPDPWAVPTAPKVSEATRQLIDREVRRLVDGCYDQAVETLRAHHHRLDALAAELLERETLDEATAYAVAGLPRPGCQPDERADVDPRPAAPAAS